MTAILVSAIYEAEFEHFYRPGWTGEKICPKTRQTFPPAQKKRGESVLLVWRRAT